MSSAHAAIGKAICASQIFETVLTVSFETFRMVTDPEYRELTEGKIELSRFKTPIKNLLKFLSSRNDIAPELESQIVRLLEDRHTVVHRWSLENGFADPTEEEHWQRYEALALKVESESKRIALLLLSFINHWAESPSTATSHEEYLGRMKQLFHTVTKQPAA